MASSKAKNIQEIDDVLEMARTMTALGISFKGMTTLDEMKAKVKEEFNPSDEKLSWMAVQVRILQVEYN